MTFQGVDSQPEEIPVESATEADGSQNNGTEDVGVVNVLNSSATDDSAEDSEGEAVNTTHPEIEEAPRWLKRNETSLKCAAARDMDVSAFLVTAVASDRGIHLFMPRYLSLSPARNAIYKQILLPPPSMELRSHLATLINYSYSQISSHHNLLMFKRVRWSPFSLHLAALTIDGQVIRQNLKKSENLTLSKILCCFS